MINSYIRRRTNLYTKICIAIIVLVNFQLLMPFNVSSNSIARVFTTDKVLYYFSFTVILLYIYRFKMKLIGKIPGLKVMLLIILWMALSTYLAEHIDTIPKKEGSIWMIIGKHFGYAMFTVAVIMVLRSFEAIETYLKWSLYLSFIIIIISFFNLLDITSVLPAGEKTSFIKESVAGQTTIPSAFSLEKVKRKAFLWFDANNFAYLLVPQVLYLIHILFTGRSRTVNSVFRNLPHYFMLSLFIITIIQTMSRGAAISLLIGGSLVFFLTKSHGSKKLIFFIIVIATIGVLAVYGFSSNTLEFLHRLYLATGLLGYEPVSLKMTPYETGRSITAALAFEDFLRRPVFGWGSASVIGAYSKSANHLGYFNTLAKYGIIGAVLYLTLLIIIFSKLRQSILYLKKHKDLHLNLGYLLFGIIAAKLCKGLFAGVNIIELMGIVLPFYLAVDILRRNNQHEIVLKKVSNEI